MPEYEQLTLDLEYHMYDHYTIELRKGAMGDMQTVRSNTAKSVEDAENLIDGLRESCLQRDGVTWQHDEVDDQGNLYGLVDGVLWHISVVPPLTEVLAG
jgi:hypothetical protein